MLQHVPRSEVVMGGVVKLILRSAISAAGRAMTAPLSRYGWASDSVAGGRQGQAM